MKLPVTLVTEPTDPVVADVFERLSKGTVGVVNIHRTIAASPDVFAAFIGLAHALRFKTQIGAAARELAILRVLELHHGHYEIGHHTKMAIAAGASEAQAKGATAAQLDPELYDDAQRAVLRYAEAFAIGTGVPPHVALALEQHLDNRQRVELTMTLALYVGLAHLTCSLDVPVD